MDYNEFEPPGRLGKRLGNLFVAVGGRREKMGVVDLQFCAKAIAQVTEEKPVSPVFHLLDPELPSRRQLVEQLKRQNPGLHVVWIPRWSINTIGLLTFGLQKLFRPGRPPIDVAAIFAHREYDNTIATNFDRILTQEGNDE